MNGDASVVSIKGLSKVFGKGGVSALEGIDLQVERGEFVSLIGPSGCGKSTMVRCVNRMHEEIPGARSDHVTRQPAGDVGASR